MTEMNAEILERLKMDAEDHANGQCPDERALKEHAADLRALIEAYQAVREAVQFVDGLFPRNVYSDDEIQQQVDEGNNIAKAVQKARDALSTTGDTGHDG